MLLGIDHVVIACADPDAAAGELERELGLRASGGGRHQRLGTFNRLVWLGDSYLELIGVADAGLAIGSWIGAPTVRALEGGGGLATFAIASDALVADLERLREHGSLLEGPLPGERVRTDGRVVRWRLALPPRLGPDAPPFLIEHDGAAAEWSPAERAERAAAVHPAGGPVRLEALELSVADVQRAQVRYLRSSGLIFRPSLAGRGARDATVGAQTVRLRPLRGPDEGGRTVVRLRVLDVSGADVAADLLGCRFVLRRGG